MKKRVEYELKTKRTSGVLWVSEKPLMQTDPEATLDHLAGSQSHKNKSDISKKAMQFKQKDFDHLYATYKIDHQHK
jgi:hypothetical protein